MGFLDFIPAPGARVEIRDAQWLVRSVDNTITGGYRLNVTGVSEIVKDKEAVFLTEIDKDIKLLDPVLTELVPDETPNHIGSFLYIESLLRKSPPTDEKIYAGHKAAMDEVTYQLDPAVQALKQPRQRILIADAVGLGKTIEAGILLTELIKRGKGKRILVLTVKSMLTQFQKEIWSRFSIPLTRLDSVAIQKIRQEIPTNHNPFYYYDKSIISIDTLKQSMEYRNYIENAWWDIIVIDEAHNVAKRGNGYSQRAKLASLLSRRSDTLIMLSATPHDGKASSFASLMNMLDKTAIANPDNYGPEDIKGLYIRRFKKDILNQVKNSFKERQILKIDSIACEKEESAFDYLSKINFESIDKNSNDKNAKSILFKVTLEKALFSSPLACASSIKNRIKKLEKKDDKDFSNDIEKLKNLLNLVKDIDKESFSKYQKLISFIKDKDSGFAWTGKDKEDRLVIFTERIETLKFLSENIKTDLKLKENQISILHGGLSDIEQQKAVEDFGITESPVRLMIASDVASEGINLHYLSHKMIHFDIPWSLMVFQQRNGRIDRYGQEKIPKIAYFLTRSENKKIKGDTRILELLIQKDEETVKNIGDPAEFFKVYDSELEEEITARAISEGKSAKDFEDELSGEDEFNPLALLFEEEPVVGEDAEINISSMPSLFKSDYEFLKQAIFFERQNKEKIKAEFYDDEKRIDLKASDDLLQRFKFYPSEIRPKAPDNELVLCADKEIIIENIKKSRKDEKTWPGIHYLWEMNPVVKWMEDKIISSLKRHSAPVIDASSILNKNENIFILSGLFPNRKGQPVFQKWAGICFKNKSFKEIKDFESISKLINPDKNNFPNTNKNIDTDELSSFLGEAVEKMKTWLLTHKKEFESDIKAQLDLKLKELQKLENKKFEQLELFKGFDKEARKRKVKSDFKDYQSWIKDTMTIEDQPFIQVIAVLYGGL
ncbi:MAG: DEAD/DEAH box helicase [Desulforegulaceae bacterium]|nr:DEAD/DEAH box helicase [Desulforegulaceae bacterium]